MTERDLSAPPQPPPGDRLEEELLAAQGEMTPPAGDVPPGGEGAAVEPEVLFDPALVSLLVGIPFDLLAARRGEHWRLSDGEKDAIVPVLGRVLDKYLPSALGRFGDELALLTVLSIVVVPRIQRDAQIEADAAAVAPGHPGAPRYDRPDAGAPPPPQAA